MSPSAGEKQLCYVKPPCGILYVAPIHYTAALLSFITIHYFYQPALTLSVTPLVSFDKDRPLSFSFVFLLRFIFPIGLWRETDVVVMESCLMTLFYCVVRFGTAQCGPARLSLHFSCSIHSTALEWVG